MPNYDKNINLEQAARRLLNDREALVPFCDFPSALTPTTISRGYQIQDYLIKKYEARGDKLGGWKVGLASTKMQAAVGIPHPIEGPILASLIQESEAQLSISNYLTLCVEAEVAFIVGNEIGARKTLWKAPEISEQMESVAVAIEIADDRASNNTVFKGGGLNVANFVHNAGCVIGPPIKNWSKIDLAEEKLKITLNDQYIGSGFGSTILGNPINSVTWLANNLSRRGYKLSSGSVIMTGCVTESIWLNPADKLSVESQHLGNVCLQLGP